MNSSTMWVLVFYPMLETLGGLRAWFACQRDGFCEERRSSSCVGVSKKLFLKKRTCHTGSSSSAVVGVVSMCCGWVVGSYRPTCDCYEGFGHFALCYLLWVFSSIL